MAKTLLLLGGARYALPVIEAAHELGARVVTCDYLPDNFAHRFSDDYVNASIADKDAVLAVATDVRADGIMSFAADPGVVPAAYAAERLGLPYQGSYEAVSILQNKDRFRGFLRDNGFNCPESFRLESVEEADGIADGLSYPVIVKIPPQGRRQATGGAAFRCGWRRERLSAAVESRFFFDVGRLHSRAFLEKSGDTSDADASECRRRWRDLLGLRFASSRPHGAEHMERAAGRLCMRRGRMPVCGASLSGALDFECVTASSTWRRAWPRTAGRTSWSARRVEAATAFAGAGYATGGRTTSILCADTGCVGGTS